MNRGLALKLALLSVIVRVITALSGDFDPAR